MAPEGTPTAAETLIPLRTSLGFFPRLMQKHVFFSRLWMFHDGDSSGRGFANALAEGWLQVAARVGPQDRKFRASGGSATCGLVAG